MVIALGVIRVMFMLVECMAEAGPWSTRPFLKSEN